MEAKLPPEQAKALDNDLATLMSRKGLNLGQLRELTNGMDAKDVRKAADEANAQWKAAHLAQVQARIKVLETEDSKNKAELAELSKFGVKVNDVTANVKSSNSFGFGGFNGDVAMSVTLQNQTSYSINEFGYDLALTINEQPLAPDPWSYHLQKPLAPGESVTIQITDKSWNGQDTMGYSLSSRVVQAIVDAFRTEPKPSLSATVSVSSVTSTDGVFHNPAKKPNAELESLKQELADNSQ